MKLKCKIVNKNCIPSRAHLADAGLDMRADKTVRIMPGENTQIGLGVCVAIPYGYVGLLFPRSSMGVKTMLRPSTTTGVIDPGYTGIIHHPLTNHGTEPMTINEGDRIAQLVIVPCLTPDIEIVDDLGPSERGANGFGSTGK